MKFRFLGGLATLFLYCACSFLKTKKVVQLRRDTIYAEQYGLENATLQVQKQEDWHQVEKMGKNQVEIIADDVFYWHPDSGLQSRKGNVKVKMKLEQGTFERYGRLRDTLLVKSKGESVGKSLYTVESLHSTEKVLEKKERLGIKWEFFAIGIALCLLVGLGLKMLSR